MPTAVEQIMWTAVPNGIGTGQPAARSSTLGSRLADASGGSYGHAQPTSRLQNWPTAIRDSTARSRGHFHVGFTNSRIGLGCDDGRDRHERAQQRPCGRRCSARRHDPVHARARRTRSTLTTTPVVSYPADQVASFLQTTYTNLRSTRRPPTRRWTRLRASTAASGTSTGTGSRNSTTSGTSSRRSAWTTIPQRRRQRAVLQRLEHDQHVATRSARCASTTWPRPARASRRHHAAVALPTVDFHRALTFIGEHRTLQRALGLVFDVTVPIDGSAVARTRRQQRRLRARGSAGNVDGTLHVSSVGVTYHRFTPRTQCDASTSVFEAYARQPRRPDRRPPADARRPDLILDLRDRCRRRRTEDRPVRRQPEARRSSRSRTTRAPRTVPPPTRPQSYAPPALRSAGLTVAAVNRGQTFVSRLGNANATPQRRQRDTPSVPDLTAEDLVKGFVLDVYDGPGSTWHSTSMRDVTYAVSSASISIGRSPTSRGPTRRRGMQNDPTDSSQPQLNLPENLIRWNGWSNAAPRPGAPLADDGSTTPGGRLRDGPFSQIDDHGDADAPARCRGCATATPVRAAGEGRRHRRQRDRR